jgi:hypothetical protein
MEAQTLPLDFRAEDPSEQLKMLTHRMSEFIALYEMAETKIRDREKKLKAQLTEQERSLEAQLTRINQSIEEITSVMTEVGVARWRVSAETAMREGEAHLQALQNSIETFRQLSDETCQRLDQATAFTVKGVADAVSSFRATDFRQLTEDSCSRVERTTITAVKNIARVTRWFYWKKLLLVFCFSLLVAMIFGMYVNGEWPWQTHNQVMQQRLFGTAVLNNWNQLSPADQQLILSKVQT